MVIVRDDLLGQAPAEHARRCSTTSCRPTAIPCSTRRRPIAMYIAGLVFRVAQDSRAALTAMEKRNVAKAKLLYDYLTIRRVLSSARSASTTARA